MKKISLPDRERLKIDRSPYLDVEIAATRATIERALNEGYRLKTIWRSLRNTGDITGSYSGFLKALQRNGGSQQSADEISVIERTSASFKNRSERESEAAMAEAKEVLAARAAAK